MADASETRTLRTLALDTSHLGQFVQALNSRRADERRQAAEFEAHLDAGTWVLALSYHHLAEIYTHADPEVRAQRLSYIRSLPVIAYVRSRVGNDSGAGTVVDVLATEVVAALKTGSDDTVAIADAARPNVFGYASGSDVMRAFAVLWRKRHDRGASGIPLGGGGTVASSRSFTGSGTTE